RRAPGEQTAPANLTFLTDRCADTAKLIGHVLVQFEDVIQRVGDLACKIDLIDGETNRKITLLECDQGREYLTGIHHLCHRDLLHAFPPKFLAAAVRSTVRKITAFIQGTPI